MDRITSRQNPIVARFREAARAPGPGTPLLLDGAHLIDVALACGTRVVLVATRHAAPPGHDDLAGLLDRLAARHVPVVSVSAAVMDVLSPVRSASPIVALADRPPVRPSQLVVPAPALVVVAAGVQDAGNVGAIVRAADAACATGVITLPGSADPFGWKALRGAMGSTLRLPVWGAAPWRDADAFLRGAGLRLVAADAGGRHAFDDADLAGPTALIVGNEGRGLDPDVLAACDDTVRIPMRAGVESLNVAVTAALLAYEARRQRRAR